MYFLLRNTVYISYDYNQVASEDILFLWHFHQLDVITLVQAYSHAQFFYNVLSDISCRSLFWPIYFHYTMRQNSNIQAW